MICNADCTVCKAEEFSTFFKCAFGRINIAVFVDSVNSHFAVFGNFDIECLTCKEFSCVFAVCAASTDNFCFNDCAAFVSAAEHIFSFFVDLYLRCTRHCKESFNIESCKFGNKTFFNSECYAVSIAFNLECLSRFAFAECVSYSFFSKFFSYNSSIANNCNCACIDRAYSNFRAVKCNSVFAFADSNCSIACSCNSAFSNFNCAVGKS